jgi:Na+-transporting methylmalonyl-CoA/oxaloacetate decarboxylase gamma subunit
MQPVDWSEALRIVVGGVLAVFIIMSILAGVTTILGKVFAARAKKEAQAAAAEGKK